MRTKDNIEQWGLCWLTKRLDALCDAKSLEITCTSPRHKLPGFRCSNEMSARAHGGKDNVRRRLKLWILLGACDEDRAHHMDRDWGGILTELLKAGWLPTESAIDQAMVNDWDAIVEVPLVAQNPPTTRGSSRRNLLGKSFEGEEM